MLVRLEVAHQKANVKKVVLKADTVIGRSADCNLRIASSEISRRHCQLTVTDTDVFVRDLGSSNGTFVDGDRLEPNAEVSLKPDCELSLGGIRFVVRFKPPQTAPDPGSTVDLPAIASETAPPESDGDGIESTLLDENGPPSDPSPAEPAVPEDSASTPVKILADNPPGAAANDTLFSAELAEGDTVQTQSAVPSPAIEADDAPPEIDTVQQHANAAAEDTIDMRIEEDGATPVATVDVDDSAQTESSAEAGDVAPAKRWSLFGMFKRKRSAEDAATALSDTKVEPAEETVAADEHLSADEPAQSPSNPDETIIEPELPFSIDESATDESATDEAADAESPGDDVDMTVIAPGLPVDEAAAEPADDDEALGDFLSNLS